MNSCIGYPTGLSANAYTTQTAGTSTTLVTTIIRNLISITLNLTDRLRLLTIQLLTEMYKYLQMHFVLEMD